MQAISTTDFPNLKLFRRGKVRDVYDLGEHLLFVATDRLSAFDVVIPDPIPMKGRVLTALSEFWFEKFEGLTKHHFITANVDEFPEECKPYADTLRGRSMLVRKTEPIMAECIVRGYLTGSGLKEYNKQGTVCSIPLPDGLVDGSELPEVLFTPSTKAEEGEHDENISYERMVDIIGAEVGQKVRDLSIKVYAFARDFARERGIIIADTKFEFGIADGDVYLIDEVLTPDSSRFWPMSEYEPGKAQPSFDKQYVRDHLAATGWDKKPPAPHLPEDVIAKTTEKYLEAYKLVTGKELTA